MQSGCPLLGKASARRAGFGGLDLRDADLPQAVGGDARRDGVVAVLHDVLLALLREHVAEELAPQRFELAVRAVVDVDVEEAAERIAAGDRVLGRGRDVLAAMLNVMSSGYARVGKGQDEMYVWPYFAETGLTALTPSQEVELYRIVPPQLAAAMKKSGKYSYYRLGIAASGVWHYFLQ